MYGVIDLVVFAVAVTAWVRGVEERELEARFGEAYREYRKRTPFYVPKPGRER